MIIEKIEQGEMVRGCKYYLDYINCGGNYLLTEWDNKEEAAVTLNESTVLEDLHEKHGGLIWYRKFRSNTFCVYMSISGALQDEDLDKVVNWTEIDHWSGYYHTQLLKALITGGQPKERSVIPCIVRWANEESSRGIDWYRVLKD